MFEAERLRGQQIATLRNWQREMERSCDELRKLGPDMEEAALGNAYVAEALEDAADTILAIAEDCKRMAQIEAAARKVTASASTLDPDLPEDANVHAPYLAELRIALGEEKAS